MVLNLSVKPFSASVIQLPAVLWDATKSILQGEKHPSAHNTGSKWFRLEGKRLALPSLHFCCCSTIFRLVLQADGGQQSSALEELKQSLSAEGVTLDVQYSSSIHDREIRYCCPHLISMNTPPWSLWFWFKFHGSDSKLIVFRFNNGWIIKIGRGLDYFKRPKVRPQTKSYQYICVCQCETN